MQRKMVRAVLIVLVLVSLSSLMGCAGMEYAPKEPSILWYYPTQLPEADRAVEAARKAGKDKECPVEFNAANAMKEEAYRLYWACRDKEAIAKAMEATKKTKELCPAPPPPPPPPPPPFASSQITDERVRFEVGDAGTLRSDIGPFDAIVSGLVLNFIPQPDQVLTGMKRVTRKGGVVTAYVWDYAEGMQLMRHFWDAAVELDPKAADIDQVKRFPHSRPEPLKKLFQGSGFQQVEVIPIEVPTHFHDFDDYWSPFLGGQGPAPSYAMSLSEEARSNLREKIRTGLPMPAQPVVG